MTSNDETRWHFYQDGAMEREGTGPNAYSRQLPKQRYFSTLNEPLLSTLSCLLLSIYPVVHGM